mgnify:CR=1 FL=1
MPIPKTKTYQAAKALLDAGVSVLPIVADGTKKPTLPTWKQWQKELPTSEHIERWFANGNGIAIIGGLVSGNLCIMDFDEPALCDEFEQVLLANDCESLINSLPRAQTPSGGSHLYFRVNGEVGGSRKLARNAKGETAIETRGEGGYAIIPPTAGYKIIRGRPNELPIITPEEYSYLCAFAKSFDLYNDPQELAFSEPAPRSSGLLSPGEDFSERGDAEAVLQKHGWKLAGQRGATTFWTRPGKNERRAVSATWNYGGFRKFYAFSSNALPFEEKKGYSAWRVYGLLEHGGDWKAAAKSLANEGYGTPDAEYKAQSAKERTRLKTKNDGEPYDGSEVPSAQTETPDADEEQGTTEEALAKAWAEASAGRWLFVQGDQWYEYAGNRWRISTASEAMANVQAFLTGRVKLTATKVRNVYAVARLMTGIGVIPLANFNAHKNWIPLQNGVYDTETGELLPHSPDHLLTYILPYDYILDADCPTWRQCLSEWLIHTDGSICQEWIDLLASWYGYCLLPDNTAQLSLFWLGEGGNGKGVATRVLTQLVGNDNVASISIEKLDDPYFRAGIYGKLVGLVNEPDKRALQKNGEVFKALTGGEDTLNGRQPGFPVFYFHSTCRIIVSCNQLPNTSDNTRSFYRRIVPIYWRYNVPDEKRDPYLNDKLASELPGILNWALAGLAAWKQAGKRFAMPEESKKLLNDYKSDQDHIGRFFEEQLEFTDKGDFIQAAMLFADYRLWCENEGIRSETSNMLGKRLTKKGCTRTVKWIDSASARVWNGVKLYVPKKDEEIPDAAYTR